MEMCESEERDQMMVTCEFEAAEVLAGMSRVRVGASFPGDSERAGRQIETESMIASSSHCQDQEVAVQNFCGNISITITSALNTEETVRTVPNQKFSSSYQSNTESKLRHKSTEAEKETKRLRRVLANRESARQTIRRRQALHLELTRKATDLSEENKNLKKEKEVAMEKYNSLKDRNEFLKVQMAKLKKTEPRKIQEEAKLSQEEISSTSSPIYLYNQPSLVPFFWPNAFQFQYPSRSDIMFSSQIPMQHSDVPSLVLPVPWLFPFLSHSNQPNSQSGNNERRGETSSTHQWITSSSDNHQMPSNHYTGMRPQFKGLDCDGPTESLEPTRDLMGGDIYNHNANYAPESKSRGLLKTNKEPNICFQKISEHAVAATKARRRRKELLKLKNIH